jgi:uncharacterized protein (TIGR02466 family)
MSFDLHFPTAILHETILNSKEINQQILPRIEEIRNTIPCGGSSWIGKPYNTCGTFDISKDPAFETIIKEVRAMVHLYASRLGVDVSRNKFVCSEAWLNIYKQSDFQEFHHHAGHHFSAVYYVKVPEGSSQLVFETPLAPEMKPLPINMLSSITDQRARYTATEGNCIIFRSNLKHCVPAHQGAEERISLAFNFD